MMRRVVSIVIFLSVLALFLYSCADDVATPPESASRSDADAAWLDEQLGSAPEVRELIEIRDMIASRAVSRRITTQQVREVAGDAEHANELLGFSRAEAGELMGRVEQAIASLRRTYPSLDELMARAAPECDACDVERLAATWERYLVVAGEATGEGAETGDVTSWAPAREPLRCKMSQLIIGFGMCAVKSGGSLLFYTVCSYAVFCSSCSGGVAGMICP